VKPAPIPADEGPRLAELRSLHLLDTDAEERFDRVTRLAQRLFDVPIALVSLIDEDRQWFKSNQGLDATETPRDVSFCGHAIVDEGVMHIADATTDDRFSDNPLVQGEPRIRFYAGCPIAGPGGSKLGTLCIIDREPRALSEDDKDALRDLAEMVEREVAATHLAATDALTGLSNRRGFDLLATKVLEISKRRGSPAVLLFIDVDGLKPINDSSGHEAGDELLRELARLLERVFRASDVVARIGGDEFAVLLSATNDLYEPVYRLRQAIDERNRAAPGTPALSASVGAVAFDPLHPEALEGLCKRADDAMYVNKYAKRQVDE
jgi:diguanylate cyclase (GGDEF)-like protein